MGWLLPGLLVAGAAAESVVVLSTAAFDDAITSNDLTLVEFYAPWCGHCKQLAPEFEKAAEELLGKVLFAKVDATIETKLAERYDIQGYPTIKLFRNTEPEDYDGGRTKDDFIGWLDANTGPSIKEANQADLQAFIESKHAQSRVVISLQSPAHANEIHDLRAVAEKHRKVGIYVWTEAPAVSLVVHHPPSAVPVDQPKFEGPWTPEGLLHFVLVEQFPPFGEITTDNYDRYNEDTKSLGLLWACFDPGTLKEDLKQHQEMLLAVSKQYRGVYNFVWLDTNNYADHAKTYLGCETYPTLVLQVELKTKGTKYLWHGKPGEMTVAAVTEFIEGVRSGKVDVHVRSEPVPTTNPGPVRKVVARTFDREVLSEKEKDVLIFIYAPWCGHCKALFPIYEHLAEHVETSQAPLVIAKMDGTENESPTEDFEWTGFPAIFFVPAGSGTPVKFTGDRTFFGLMSFMKQHSKLPRVQQLTDAPAKGSSGEYDELKRFVELWTTDGATIVDQMRKLLAENADLKEKLAKSGAQASPHGAEL